MKEHLAWFENRLSDATQQIGQEYFQLPIADADTIYRERVYCYELYHQLRILWDDFPFSLGGEVDKRGHPHFQNSPYQNAKPDLLVHLPGRMDQNLACVEVKPLTRPNAEFADDLAKLTWFCDHANYYRGIFLVYGPDENLEIDRILRERILGAAEDREDIKLDCVDIFHHSTVGLPAHRIGM